LQATLERIYIFENFGVGATGKRKERGRDIVIKVGRRSQIEENISERKGKVPYAKGMRGGERDGPTLSAALYN